MPPHIDCHLDAQNGAIVHCRPECVGLHILEKPFARELESSVSAFKTGCLYSVQFSSLEPHICCKLVFIKDVQILSGALQEELHPPPGKSLQLAPGS